jgi:hypothetical protein
MSKYRFMRAFYLSSPNAITTRAKTRAAPTEMSAA